MDAVVITSKDDLQRVLDDTLDETIPRLLEELKPPQESPKEWFSNREAQEFLDVSKATLQRWRADDLLPYSKISGSVYYKRADLLRVLQEHRVEGNS